MQCKVLQSFAGPVYDGAKGKTINIPLDEARSLAWAGIVEILEDYVAPVAWEIPEVEVKQTRIIKPKKRGI